tara:strand:- start:1073 stop:1858 length:786 start_codon:yes stop_codon:yes gene_type:complete
MAEFDPIAAGGIPAGPSPGSIQAPSSSSAPVVAAGNPPGFDEMLRDQVERYKVMSKRAEGYATDMYPLLSAARELKVAPTGVASGPGYNAGAFMSTVAPEWLHRAASFVTNLGGAMGGGIMTPEQVQAYAKANKFLTQAQLSMPGAARSDQGGQTAAQSSPNVHIPNDAAQAVLQGMIGLRRMEHDQLLQFQQSGLPAHTLNGFVTKFQTRADPRVYVWDQMDAKHRGQILDKMPADKRQDFIRRVQDADRNGLYNTFGVD